MTVDGSGMNDAEQAILRAEGKLPPMERYRWVLGPILLLVAIVVAMVLVGVGVIG